MYQGLIIFGAFVAVAFVAAAAKHRNDEPEIYGMEDTPVSIDNIRKGVARGWYTAVLVRVNGKPAVRLSGIAGDGKPYTDVFPITQEDFDTLQAEGYLIEL